MYIVSQILAKALQTSQQAVVASTVPTISRVLSSDFIGMIQRKLRDEHYPRAATKGSPPLDTTIVAFLVLLNNLDVAMDYTRRIVRSHIDQLPRAEMVQGTNNQVSTLIENYFPLGHDAALVRDSLGNLESSFALKASELITDGVYVAFKNIFKSRVRLVLAEAFREGDYLLKQETEDTLDNIGGKGNHGSEGIGAEVWEKFQAGWERLSQPLLRLLTERNCEKLLNLLASFLSEMLEKKIWSYYRRLDHHGAVRLERDIAGIVNIVIRGGRYRLREAFSRCMQICLIMNMEREEWEGLLNTSSGTDQMTEWQLDKDERLRARTMIRDSTSTKEIGTVNNAPIQTKSLSDYPASTEQTMFQ